jgi:hypothetical protein
LITYKYLDGLSNPIPLFKLQNIACDYRDFHLMPLRIMLYLKENWKGVFYLVLLEKKQQQLIHNLKKNQNR